MPPLRRRLLLLLPLAAAAHAEPAPPALTLDLAGPPGSLRLANPGPSPRTLARAIAVERPEGAGWIAMPTEFNAVPRCTRPAATGPVTLPPGAVLDVVPWRGFTCAGQCERSCRHNLELGPGPFRFTVTLLPAGARISSSPFRMPPTAAR